MPGEDFIHESFIGYKFTARIEEFTETAGKPAIIPSIEGRAKITVTIPSFWMMMIPIFMDFK